MRILQLPTHVSGVSYYRHHLPSRALVERGHTVHMRHDADAFWMAGLTKEQAYDWAFTKAAESDIIHMGWSNNLEQIELGVALRTKFNIPFVIDYDDDVLHVDRYNVNYKVYHEGSFSRRVARLGMRVADCVTVSTEPLKEALAKECRYVEVLPNYTHPPDWQDMPVDPARADDKSVRVMFAGGKSHLGDLANVKEAMEWVVGHYDGKEGRPHVKAIFLSCMPDWAGEWLKDTRHATANRAFFIDSTENEEAWQRVIRWVAPDVLVAPLTHNDFNKSKSLIKAYDAAMVEGCAFVCEDWATYEEVPKEAAYKTSGEEWQIALREVIEYGELRRKISTNLHQWLLDKRTIGAHICEWESAYEKVLSRPLVSQLSDVVRPPHLYGPDGQLLDS